MAEREKDWLELTAEEKRSRLYVRQKALLDLYLEKKAITKADYDKSIKTLKEQFRSATNPNS